jgi:hypothetical protein
MMTAIGYPYTVASPNTEGITYGSPIPTHIPPHGPLEIAPPLVGPFPPQPQFGWLCPVCKRGIAPDVKHCDHGHAPPK